jgi:hypothetical protein
VTVWTLGSMSCRLVMRTSSVARRRFSTTTTSSTSVMIVVSPSWRTGHRGFHPLVERHALDLHLLGDDRLLDRRLCLAHDRADADALGQRLALEDRRPLLDDRDDLSSGRDGL